MFRVAVALSALGLVLASALCVQAQEQTEIRTWLGHKSCAVYRVSLPEGSARFQLVPSEAPTTYTYSLLGIATGCLRSEGGVCKQLADASPAACAVATDTGLYVPTAGPLTGQLGGLQPGAEGFVYISNPHAYPVLVDVLVVITPGPGASGRRHSRWVDALSLLRQLSAKAPQVVLEPASRPASSFRSSLQGASIASGSAAAHGSRRRLHNHFHHGNDDDDHGGFGGFFGGHHGGGRGANCTNGTRTGGAAATAGAANSTGSANSASGATTDVLNPNTGNTTATATTASNLIDQAANNYTGATRTWVKVAIIVAIVVVSLALLAMAACLVMCLCRRPRREAPAVPVGKQFINA